MVSRRNWIRASRITFVNPEGGAGESEMCEEVSTSMAGAIVDFGGEDILIIPWHRIFDIDLEEKPG
jgi:hypothetical protein